MSNVIFTIVDRDGDRVQFTTEPEGDDSSGIAIGVRQDGRASVAYLEENEVDDLIDDLMEYRGREVPTAETDYDRRLRAMYDAKPLVQGIFGAATPEHLVMVAWFLLHGAPEVQA